MPLKYITTFQLFVLKDIDIYRPVGVSWLGFSIYEENI